MSEKEIMSWLQSYLKYPEMDDPKYIKEAIQGLLDLYNKEKEKNKQLTDEYMIQKHLINADFLKDYISKDKVKKVLINSANEDKYDFHSAYKKLFEDFEKLLEE